MCLLVTYSCVTATSIKYTWVKSIGEELMRLLEVPFFKSILYCS